MDFLENLAATLEFISVLNDLARRTSLGFVPFSTCGSDNRDEWEDKIVYLDDPSDGTSGMSLNDIVADVVVAAGHHDVVSTYGDLLTSICKDHPVTCSTSDDPDDYLYICIDGLDIEIVVGDGRWYVDGR